jgi:hypothetical protein
LIARFRFTLPGTSSERAARTNSGRPAKAVRHSSSGSSSISNENSPSAGERFGLRAIVFGVAILHPSGAIGPVALASLRV